MFKYLQRGETLDSALIFPFCLWDTVALGPSEEHNIVANANKPLDISISPSLHIFLLLYVWIFGQYVTSTTFSLSLCVWKRFSGKYFPIELFVSEMNTGSHGTFCLNGCPTPSSSRLWVAARSHLKSPLTQTWHSGKIKGPALSAVLQALTRRKKGVLLICDWKPQWPLTDKKKEKPSALWPAQVEGGGL